MTDKLEVVIAAHVLSVLQTCIEQLCAVFQRT